MKRKVVGIHPNPHCSPLSLECSVSLYQCRWTRLTLTWTMSAMLFVPYPKALSSAWRSKSVSPSKPLSQNVPCHKSAEQAELRVEEAFPLQR